MPKRKDHDIEIEMEPNASGTFEAKRTRTSKKKAASESRDVRPRPKKKSRQSGSGRRVARKDNNMAPAINRSVPDPVQEIREGFEAGLEIIKGINSVMRAFK